MPTENRTRTTVSKPLTPALSSNLRAKPSFAPRLAGNGPTSPATVAPRTLRQQTLSPERNDEERTISLNSNITPRSGARASRVDTDSPSTPDTSGRVRAITGESLEDAQNSHGLGITSPTPNQPQRRPKSSEQLSMLPTARRISGGSNASQAKEDSKFFRADDVRSNAVPGKANNVRPRSAYIPGAQSPRVSPKKVAADPSDKMEEKFFYANNVSTHPNSRPRTLLANKFSASSSALSSTRSLPTQSLNRSPTSSLATNQLNIEKSARQAPTQSQPVRQRSSSNATSATAISSAERRRSSSLNIRPALSGTSNAHRKSLSTSSANITPIKTNVPRDSEKTPKSAHVYSGNVSQTAVVTSPDSLSQRSTSITSGQTTATSVTSEATKPDHPPTRPPFVARHTRGSSETIQLQPITQAQIEAAANARRERKVLDLEISNSSLLAINRTLEKELRKQNTELRRFRRLSRSGRLSLTPSHRIVSGASIGTLTTLEEDDHDLTQTTFSPTSSDGGSYNDEDSPSEDDNDSAFTESSDVLRRRARDEKRLMQDLQRHQQILLDSQKLTQSIQRCLNCTDELIKDGTKALAYQVEANEVQIGGRVLTHDDDEALSEVDFSEYTESMSKPRQGLLSPIVPMTDTEEAAMWARSLRETGALDAPLESSKQEAPESPSPSTLSPIILPER